MMPIASSVEVRTLIEKHEATRPDALIATHPHASKDTRDEYTRWYDDHRRLKTLLGMALATEEAGWKPVVGGEEPILWTEGKGNFRSLQFANQQKKANGRPLGENPSREALRLREKRAVKNEVA